MYCFVLPKKVGDGSISCRKPIVDRVFDFQNQFDGIVVSLFLY